MLKEVVDSLLTQKTKLKKKSRNFTHFIPPSTAMAAIKDPERWKQACVREFLFNVNLTFPSADLQYKSITSAVIWAGAGGRSDSFLQGKWLAQS